MKREDSVKNTVDVIVTLLQTIILAVIPIILDELKKWQIVAYLVVFATHILFLIVIKDRLIKNIVLAQGIEISKLQEETVIETFKEIILPNSLQIKKFVVSDETDKYFLFTKWNETSKLVIVYFSSDFINKKLQKKRGTSFSSNEIYEKDLQIVVDILINSYSSNQGFKTVVSEYKCKTFKSDVDVLYEKLKKIKSQIN